MSDSRLSDFAFKPLVVAIACGSGMQVAQAQSDTVTMLPAIAVTAEPEVPYKAESASPKFTAPLRDTPKSVTVIPQEIIQERGVTSLLDVLRTTPGITLGSGEGGTPLGDRPFIRGYEASTDMMIDGVRNLGRFAHASFNTEQVEIVKGPGSAYSGRGSTGGSINMVSKQPKAENAFSGTAGVGADKYRRFTVDANWLMSPSIALRLNAMDHEGVTPGRGMANKAERRGIAPTITFGLDGATQATLGYYHLRADDVPDFGHPFDTLGNGTPLVPGAKGEPVKVHRDNFYGIDGRDARRNETDQFTLELKHRFGNGMRLRNLTRHGENISQYIVTRPTIQATGPEAGMVTRASRTGNRQAKMFVNQTDWQGAFDLGGVENAFVVGLEFSKEELRTGATPTIPVASRTDLYNPTPGDPYTGPGLSSFSKHYDTLTNRTRTRAVYFFNTARFTPQWELNVGLRYDKYKIVGNNDGTLRNDANLLNYQLGLVYKPVSYGSVYVAYGTSSNPSGETQGQAGGADGAAGGTLGGNRPNLKPEKNRSIELGTKWDVLDHKLSLTAAVFRTEKTNQRATDPIDGEVRLIGNNRTTGLELGVAGSVTPKWSLFGGYTYLDPEMRDAGANVANNGKRLKFIAKQSLSLWSTYKITQDFTLGGGAYYMSDRYMNDANTLSVPSYWRFDAMASYRINRHLSLRLNVTNIGNKLIYEGSHVGLFANVAPGRATMLTANFKY